MTADRETVTRFLLRLGKMCRVPADSTMEESAALVGEYVPLLCACFETAAFGDEALAHVAERCAFFPCYADLVSHLREWWRANRPRPTALPAPVYADPPPPDDEAKAYVGDRVREMRAELMEVVRAKQERLAGRRRAPVAEAHLSPAALEATLRATVTSGGPGAGAAAVRLQALPTATT